VRVSSSSQPRSSAPERRTSVASASQTSWREPAWTTKIRPLLLQSMSRFFKFLPGEQRRAFLHRVVEEAS
jgi:hypothetical protein